MTLAPWLQTGREVLLLIAAVACWGFILRYAWTYRWWKNEIGRAFISTYSILAALFSYLALATAWPTIPGRVAISTSLFVALTVALVWRWYRFERTRKQLRKEKREGKEATVAYGVDIHPVYQAGYQFIGPGNLPKPTFAYIKISDGSRPYTKALPDTLVARGKRAGVPLGGYHWAQPASRTGGVGPAAQADVFIGEARRLGILDLAQQLDLEDDAKQYVWPAAEARDFIDKFTARVQALGIRPGVYFNGPMAQKLGRAFTDALVARGVVIWLARYGNKPEAPGSAQYLGHYDIHQYSSTDPALDKNESYTNAHLVGVTQEDDMAWTENDFDTALFTDNPNDPTAKRTIRFRDAMGELRDRTAELVAGQAGLVAAISALSQDSALSVDKVEEIIRSAVKENVKATVTVEIPGGAE